MTRCRSVYVSVLIVVAAFAGAATRAQTSAHVGDLPIAELQKLADAGDPAAQNELGVRYRLGSDVEKNDAAALGWFRKAGYQGYGKALFNIGAAFYNGNGVSGTRGTALYWFLLAEDVGDASGKQAVAEMRSEGYSDDLNATYLAVGDGYVKGKDIRQDYGCAMRWYRKAADGGNGAACQRIAMLYANGWGAPQDNVEIIHWLQRGADIGDPVASYDLGRAYEQGKGVPKDPQRTAKLYENAALYNNSNAMFALGGLYENGSGAKPDPEKALMWFILAAKYGNTEAAKQVTAISSTLKPKEVSKAETDAKRFMSFEKKPLALTLK